MELVRKIETKESCPSVSAWYDTNKDRLYYFAQKEVWSCRDDRVSEEYPSWWLETSPCITKKDITGSEVFVMRRDWFREADNGIDRATLIAECPACGDTVVFNDGCVNCDAVFNFEND